MNTETPKRKRAPRKRKSVVSTKSEVNGEIKHEANHTAEHKVTDEIKQRVDLNAIEMKMIHGLDEEKPTIENKLVADKYTMHNEAVDKHNFCRIQHLKAIQDLHAQERALFKSRQNFHRLIKYIWLILVAALLLWNIYRFMTMAR